MEAAAIISAALIVVGAILYVHHRATVDNTTGFTTEKAEEEACCGQHAVCERDSLLAAMSGEIEYFDDEELDAYAGTSATTYTSEQSEEFREVLLTLLPQDIAPWARSLQLRGIELPTDVREELLLLISEERAQKQTANHA